MVSRVKWDKFEAALLIDAFWEIEKAPTRKREIVRQLSIDLRKKAKNAGLEIDDVFRNVNGINMQLSPIGHAFFPDRPTLTSSTLFKQMVSLYQNDRASFNEILSEAQKQVAGGVQEMHNKNNFEKWLKSSSYKSNFSTQQIVIAIDEASRYCVEHKLCKQSFWEMQTKEEFASAANKLLGLKLFRFLHKNTAIIFNKNVSVYKEYLSHINTTNAASPTQPPTKTVTDKITEAVCKTIGSEIETKPILFTKDAFLNWLLNDKGMAKNSSASYSSAVKTAEEFACSNISPDSALFTADKEKIKNTINMLMQNVEFCRKNNDQHNRYFAALRKYLEFVQIDFDKKANTDKTEITPDIANKKEIEQTLVAHYGYGFNINSPIEMMRFKNYYSSDHGDDCGLDDTLIISAIKSLGFEFEGKVYIIPQNAFKKIENTINENAQIGCLIIYYEEFFNQNEGWLYEAHILSCEMLKQVINQMSSQYQCRASYFVLNNQKNNELETLKSELCRVWGDTVLRTVEELCESLPYIPIDKIKYALSYGEKFFWNSVETYANVDLFKISVDQIQLIRLNASKLCDENGSFLFEELPIADVSSENFELSETALYDIVFNYLSDEFSRNGKVLSRKGEAIDATTAIIQHCRTQKSCTMSELESIMQEKTGELRYPVVIEAGNAAMVRVDVDQFVSDDQLQFDVVAIDVILEDVIQNEFIGLKEITTFGAFPHCGYAWNPYLLESYCRRFSKKFKYVCITPNSKNAGVIIQKSCQLTYHEIMAKAIARSDTPLNEKDVFEFLVSAGYMIRRQYSNMKELLEQAASIRERRY